MTLCPVRVMGFTICGLRLRAAGAGGPSGLDPGFGPPVYDICPRKAQPQRAPRSSGQAGDARSGKPEAGDTEAFQAESDGHPPRPAGEARAAEFSGPVISTEGERSLGTRGISPSRRNDPHGSPVPRKQGEFSLRWK